MNNTSLNYSNTTSRTIRMDAEKLQSNTGPVVRPKAISYDKKRKATSAFTDNIDAKRSTSTVNFGPTYKSYSPIPPLNKDENIVQRKSTVDQTVGKRRSSERTSPGDAKSANSFPGTIDNHESANEKLPDRVVTYEFDELIMDMFGSNVNPTSNTAANTSQVLDPPNPLTTGVRQQKSSNRLRAQTDGHENTKGNGSSSATTDTSDDEDTSSNYVHSNDGRKYLKYASRLLENAYSQDQDLQTHRIAKIEAVRLNSFLKNMVLLRQYLELVQQE